MTPRRLRADDQTERGVLLSAQKRDEPALEALDAALKINPAVPRAHRLRAEALLHLMRYEEAVAAFDKYLVHSGRPTAEVYKLRGLAGQQLGNYAGAIEDYTHALALRPDDVGALTHRGCVYLVNDVPRLAFLDFREAVEKDPTTRTRTTAADWPASNSASTPSVPGTRRTPSSGRRRKRGRTTTPLGFSTRPSAR